MISEADAAPIEPVSPEDCDHVFPNVSDSRSDAARGAEEERGAEDERTEEESPQRKKFRVDRDTEVEVVTGVAEEEEPAEEENFERAVGEKIKKPPNAPSEKEWRIHRATHCPFRSWCPKCVAARAHQGGHGDSEESPLHCF